MGSLAGQRVCPASAAGSLACLAARLDNSWLAQLRPDPDSKYTTYQMTPDVTGKPCDTSAGGMSGPLSPASLYLLR